VTEKTDYSPVVEESAGEAHRERARRMWMPFLAGAYGFWLYALLLAGIVILLVIWLA
jgi:hypothetical protein